MSQLLLSALIQIKEQGPRAIEHGICDNVEFVVEEGYSTFGPILKRLFKSWPEYSGSLTFPVKHPDKTPHDGFINSYNLWEGEYGAARKRLLTYLIENLQQGTEQ